MIQETLSKWNLIKASKQFRVYRLLSVLSIGILDFSENAFSSFPKIKLDSFVRRSYDTSQR